MPNHLQQRKAHPRNVKISSVTTNRKHQMMHAIPRGDEWDQRQTTMTKMQWSLMNHSRMTPSTWTWETTTLKPIVRNTRDWPLMTKISRLLQFAMQKPPYVVSLLSEILLTRLFPRSPLPKSPRKLPRMPPRKPLLNSLPQRGPPPPKLPKPPKRLLRGR